MIGAVPGDPARSRSGAWTRHLAAGTVAFASLALLLQERLSGASVSGQNNIVLVPALALLACGVALFVRASARHSLSRLLLDLSPVVLMVLLSVGRGDVSELGRYGLTYLLALAWTRLLREADAVHGRRPIGATVIRLALVAGLFYALVAPTGGNRATGFFATSPTLFAYVILVSGLALAYWSRRNLDRVLVLAAVPLLFASESRSSIVVAGVLGFVALASWALRARRRVAVFVLRSVLLLFVTFAGVAGLVALDAAGTGVGTSLVESVWREGANESTLSRLGFYREVVSDFGVVTLFFGGGAGHAFDLVSDRIGRRVPPHLDSLTLLADFGLLAMFVLGMAILVRVVRRPPSPGQAAVAFAYLVSGQLHNVLFSPLALLVTLTAWHLTRTRAPRS